MYLRLVYIPEIIIYMVLINDITRSLFELIGLTRDNLNSDDGQLQCVIVM